MKTQPGPLSGWLTHACGVWVRIESARQPWRHLLPAATRRAMFGEAL